MRSTALPSYLYGNPEKVMEQRQEHEARERRRAESRPRRTLTVRKEWSEARKAAEALFTGLAGSGCSTVQSPTASAMDALPGEKPRKNL